MDKSIELQIEKCNDIDTIVIKTEKNSGECHDVIDKCNNKCDNSIDNQLLEIQVNGSSKEQSDESEEERKLRLLKKCEAMRRRRANETPEQRNNRLRADREARRLRRANESPHTREMRLQADREARRLKRATETAEQRNMRLLADREAHRIGRAMETLEQREWRLTVNRLYQRQKRAKQPNTFMAEAQIEYNSLFGANYYAQLEKHLLTMGKGRHMYNRSESLKQCPSSSVNHTRIPISSDAINIQYVSESGNVVGRNNNFIPFDPKSENSCSMSSTSSLNSLDDKYPSTTSNLFHLKGENNYSQSSTSSSSLSSVVVKSEPVDKEKDNVDEQTFTEPVEPSVEAIKIEPSDTESFIDENLDPTLKNNELETNKLITITNSSGVGGGDIKTPTGCFSSFGKHIAEQLESFPVEYALILQEKIQCLITQERRRLTV